MTRPTPEQVEKAMEVYTVWADCQPHVDALNHGRILAAEVRALREDINSGEYFRMKKEMAALKQELAECKEKLNAK